MSAIEATKTLQQLLAEAKARAAQAAAPTVQALSAPPAPTLNSALAKLAALKAALQRAQQEPKAPPAQVEPIAGIIIHDSHGRAKEIFLNEKQEQFVRLVASGKSCVLLGAAGTGKTTCTRAAIAALIQANIAPLQGEHKHLMPGVPGIVPCAYTRRATNNIKRVMNSDIAQNTITIHKLLEYSPVYYEVIDAESGRLRKTMRFEPLRDTFKPLDASVQVIVLDESSMISVELFAEITAATSLQTVFIFIGDIQQLPPVFGHAILGYKLLELPVIELTEVYRQALDSPIISLAHRVLSGKIIDSFELAHSWQFPNQLQIIQWPRKYENEPALFHACKSMIAAYDAGKYDPEEDIILCPYNKSFGTIEINKHIANHIARKKGFMTYEIIAGFIMYYYSVGDKVLYDKEDAIITAIETNASYIGKAYQEPSETLDYWGHDPESHAKVMQNADMDMDKLLELAGQADTEERTIQASHKITMQILDTGAFVTVSSLSELSGLTHAYAMTVHKSQGSEWQRVFLLLHHSHAPMVRRELLYTAITRASKQLVIICEKDTFVRGIQNQTIKGNTLEEKAEYFKGKIDSKQAQNGGSIATK